MHHRKRSLYIFILSLATLTLLCYSEKVSGQIVPDSTLGTESSTVTTDTINGIQSDRIEGGAIRGSNLFHSFREFNINSGRGAYFYNPTEILNILTRVTGNNASNINGTLGVLGKANLFLINPNGIVFGPNARLDLRGSFLASSASSLIFESGVEFSANSPETPPLLTVNIPIGLRFRNNPPPIQIIGSTLEVNPTQTLTLIGGDAIASSAKLLAPSGRVELGSIATEGIVENTPSGLNFPLTSLRGDIHLTNGTRIDVTASGGGNIVINSGNLLISNSNLNAGMAEGMGVFGNSAGDIRINVTGNTSLSQTSFISSLLQANSIGKGGNISIDTSNLSIEGGSRIQNVTASEGAAGNILINASDSINITGFTSDGLFSGILSRSETPSAGAAGNITVNNPSGDMTLSNRGFIAAVTNSSSPAGNIDINLNNLILETGGQIISITTGSGNAGNITINAKESVRLSGKSPDFLSNELLNIPNAFNLDLLQFLTAPKPDVEESGETGIPYLSIDRTAEQIISGTTVLGAATNSFDYYQFSITQGDSRAIFDIDYGLEDPTRQAAGSIDTQIFLYNLTTGELLAGNDDANTTLGGSGSKLLQDSYISVRLASPGVYLLGVGEFRATAASRSPVDGNGADVGDTYTLHVSLENRASGGVSVPKNNVTANNFNPNIGEASGFLSQTRGTGSGGKVTIDTGRLILSNGARISTDTFGSGMGGNILINAEFVAVDNSIISSVVRGTGNAGTLTMNARQLMVENGGSLDVSTFAGGNAGNVNIMAAETVEVRGENSTGDRSLIGSNVEGSATGNGGNVTISTKHLNVRDGAEITTLSFGEGNGGNIAVRAEESVNVSGRESRGQIGSLIKTTIFNDATGSGGSLTIDTQRLTLSKGGLIASETYGFGNAGGITVRAKDLVEMSSVNFEQFPTAFSNGTLGVGNAGNIRIETTKLIMQDGAQIQAGTSGSGQGGSIAVTASDAIQLSGTVPDNGSGDYLLDETGTRIPTGFFANSIDRGNAGSISLQTGRLIVSDGATASVSSSMAGETGNIEVIARNISLNNGSLRAETAKGNLGNINLWARDIQMRRGSRITTNSTSTATGGNITINTETLAALENSDNTANAQQGFGGRVNINAQGIFGTRFRQQSTPSSDITATSELGASFSGTVEIKTPDVDPSSGLVTLPQAVVDVTGLVGQDPCKRRGESAFTIAGKGGLPANPAEPLTPVALVVDWATREGVGEGKILSSQSKIANPIVPAKGWVFNDRGEVVLTAEEIPGMGGFREWRSPSTCSTN